MKQYSANNRMHIQIWGVLTFETKTKDANSHLSNHHFRMLSKLYIDEGKSAHPTITDAMNFYLGFKQG